MQQSDAALRLLGLATRAGAVVTGTQAVREAVRSNSVYYVLVASDSSENSQEKILPLLRAVGVPFSTAYDRDALGAAVGKAPLGAVGIRGKSFADRIRAEVGTDREV